MKSSAQHLLLSYAGLVLGNPEMFPQSKEALSKGNTLFVDILLKTGNRFITAEFVDALVHRWQDDDIQDVLLDPIFSGLTKVLIGQQLRAESKFDSVFELFSTLISFRSLFSAFINSSSWIPQELKANEFEFHNALSLIARVWLLNEPKLAIVKKYIQVENERVVNNLQDAHSTLRAMTGPFQDDLFKLIYSLVKLNREQVIRYFFHVLFIAAGYSKLHYEPDSVCSDGLCFNLNTVLLRLCEPFLDNASKIDLISPNFYFIFSKALHSALTSTKLGCTEAEFAEHIATLSQKPANFVTESFYICGEFLHIGIVRMMNQLTEEAQQAEKIKTTVIPRLTQQLDSLPAGNPMRHFHELHLKQFKGKIDDFVVHLVSMGTFFSDQQFARLLYSYFSFRMKWFMKLTVEELRYLPEYCLKDLLDFYMYGFRFNPHINTRFIDFDQFFDFLVYFFGTSNLIKNPYLKGSIVELLFAVTMMNDSTVTSSFVGNPSVQDFLMPALMDFYVQVEYTGMSTQFYDKFRIRFNLTRIFKFLWNQSTDQKEKISALSKTKPDLFTKFVNYLHGDVSYVLGESLDKLASIHQLQQKMSKSDYATTVSQADQRSDEQALADMEMGCTSCMGLAVENLDLLALVSSEIVAPFIRPEIVDRLAAMLNFNLAQLVGPKCSSLKVRNPEQYNFDPLKLLGMFMDIYNHLTCKTFALALAHDERSFSPDNMKRHSSLVRSKNIRSSAECDKYCRLIDAVIKLRAAGREKEQEMGEIPDEFLDPLMCTIMQDPVILPASRMTLDRSTIVTQLLNNPVDPFNRSPLTIDQVIPNSELKARIDEFLAQFRKSS